MGRYLPVINAEEKKSGNHWSIVIGVCVFLIALVWFVFGQTLGHGFVNYDDDLYVYKNSYVTSGVTLRGLHWAFTQTHVWNWHPLTTISHMLDCQMFGLHASGHHFVNVLLHTIAVLLLFLVLWQTTGGLWQSAFVAAVFAIHPLRVESVAWIAERKDVLSAVFFMLTLGAYTRYAQRPTVSRYITMSIMFALGLMSKSMLVTLPFVLLLLDYWPLQRLTLDRQSIARAVREKIPLFILAAASCIVMLIVQAHAMHLFTNLSVPMRISNAFVTYLIYMWQMFWPAKLAAFYPYTFQGRAPVILAILFLIALSANIIALGRTRPYLITGWLWYVGMLLPVIGIVQVGLQAHADRYTYLPQIGLYLLLTWTVADLSKTWPYRRTFLGMTAVIVLSALSWSARAQTQSWRDSDSLWRHALAVTRDNYIAHNNLAAFLRTGDEAKSHFEEALRLQPDYANAHHGLGVILAGKGEIDRAIEHFEKTLASVPYHTDACTDLAQAFLIKGKVREATRYYERALESAPDSPDAFNNLAWVLATCPDASVRDGARAIRLSGKAVEISKHQNSIFLRIGRRVCRGGTV